MLSSSAWLRRAGSTARRLAELAVEEDRLGRNQTEIKFGELQSEHFPGSYGCADLLGWGQTRTLAGARSAHARPRMRRVETAV